MIFLVHAANVFIQSNTCKADIGTMPPGGEFESIHGNFSHVLALFFTKPTRSGPGPDMYDVVQFQFDLNQRTEDIHDFVKTISSNEMEIEQNLLSDSMKSFVLVGLKPAYQWMQRVLLGAVNDVGFGFTASSRMSVIHRHIMLRLLA